MISLTPTCRCFHLHVPSPMRRFLFVIGAIEPCTSLHGATGRDKVHPPCTRLWPLIPPAAPSRPQPSWQGCAPEGAPVHSVTRHVQRPLHPIGRSRPRIRRPGVSSAAHSLGQSVGVCGVFPPPCQRARGASFISQPPPPLTVRPLRGVSKAFRCMCCEVRKRTDLCPMGLEMWSVGDLGLWWGCACSVPLPFQSHAGDLG